MISLDRQVQSLVEQDASSAATVQHLQFTAESRTYSWYLQSQHQERSACRSPSLFSSAPWVSPSI